MDLKTILRFVSKLKMSERGCWEWAANRSPRGYGKVTVGQQDLRSHRLAWMIFRGDIPENLFVLHRCDNPPCCNPDHLFLGTSQDNEDDKTAKNRQSKGDLHYARTNPEKLSRGSSHGNSKLDEAKVRTILTRYNGKRGQLTSLAREFGVTKATMHQVVTRSTWAHVIPNPQVPDPDKLVFVPGT